MNSGNKRVDTKKQNNIVLRYANADCIDLFVVLCDKKSYTIKQRKVLKKALKIVFYKYRSRPRENRFSPFLRSKSNRDTKKGVSFEKSAYLTDIDQGFFNENQHSIQKRRKYENRTEKVAKDHRNILQRSKRSNNNIYLQYEPKNRLTEFAKEYPELCKLASDDEMGCLTFEINKDNFTFRVMRPASDKKREKAREQMNKLRGKTEESSATIMTVG